MSDPEVDARLAAAVPIELAQRDELIRRCRDLERELTEAKATLASIHEAVGIDGRAGEPIHLAVHRICGQWNQRGVELTRSEARCARLEYALRIAQSYMPSGIVEVARAALATDGGDDGTP